MRLLGIAHVGICVDDLDAALAFYCGVLGCTVDESRPEFSVPGAWLWAGDQQIHLIESDDPTPGPARHWAMIVDSIEDWERHLDGAGVAHRRSRYRPGAGRQVVVRDPAGNAIELNEPDGAAPAPDVSGDR